jgi:hypothetical protein
MTAEIKKLCKSTVLTDKLEGIKLLQAKLKQCFNLQEQLAIYTTRCQAIIKMVIRDVKESDTDIFAALSEFLLRMIYETDYFIEIESAMLSPLKHGEILNLMESPKECRIYSLEEQKEILVK